MLDAPLWKPPSPRWRGSPGRTPSRCAAGASVPLGKAASAYALATAAAPPPLRLGAAPPNPQGSPLGKVRRSCANAHGTAFETAFAATPSQICAEAPAAQAARSSVTPLARIAAEGRASATAGGIPKGAQPSLASLCLLSAGQKVGARRGLSASKGKTKILKEGTEGQKSPTKKKKEGRSPPFQKNK